MQIIAIEISRICNNKPLKKGEPVCFGNITLGERSHPILMIRRVSLIQRDGKRYEMKYPYKFTKHGLVTFIELLDLDFKRRLEEALIAKYEMLKKIQSFQSFNKGGKKWQHTAKN